MTEATVVSAESGGMGPSTLTRPAAPRPDQPERRPADIAWVVIGMIPTVLSGMWAQSSSSVDTDLFKVINDLPNALHGVATMFNALGSIWCAAAIVVVLLITRRIPAAISAAAAAAGAWLVALGLNDWLGTRSASSLGIHVRSGSGPSFPVASVAVATALAVALSPYLPRPLRRLALLVVVLVGLSAMYLGTGLASDAVGGLWLGVAFGAAVHLLFGSPGGRPTVDAIRRALTDLGFDVTDIETDAMQIPRATVMHFGLERGDRARVVAFGRDQRDGQLAAKVWHAAMYKSPGQPAFGSRLQQVEHIAYSMMIAERGGAHVPGVLKTGVAGPDAALLVTTAPAGRALADLAEAPSDALLSTIWGEVARLHAAGVAHGDLGPDRILVDDAGTVSFAELGTAEVGGDAYWRNRDVAAVLVLSSLLVGNDRAVAVAVAALDQDELAAALPLVQPAALPPATGAGVKHLAKALKELRAAVVTATGMDEVETLEVKRLSLLNIGMLAGVLLALAIAIPGLKGVNWESVQSQFQNATWSWAILGACVEPFVIVAWAVALMGAVAVDLPFMPTVIVQLACSFLNLITPNGIGGTGLQLDYLHHQDVPVSSGASAMVLSTGVGGLTQMVLFIIAIAITATKVDPSPGGGSVTLGAIAIVTALLGLVLMIPKVRGKVVPAVKRAANDIWTVIRDPRKAMRLFGGNLAGNLLYPAILGLCLLAFHQNLGYAQLLVVQVGAGMLGNVAPVPGGIGVQEAALTAGLTSFGIPATPALATVLVFRTITFVIPPLFGFVALRWLRKRSYA